MDNLLDHPNILFPLLQGGKSGVDVGAVALDDECAVAAKDVLEVFLGPDAWC